MAPNYSLDVSDVGSSNTSASSDFVVHREKQGLGFKNYAIPLNMVKFKSSSPVDPSKFRHFPRFESLDQFLDSYNGFFQSKKSPVDLAVIDSAWYDNGVLYASKENFDSKKDGFNVKKAFYLPPKKGLVNHVLFGLVKNSVTPTVISYFSPSILEQKQGSLYLESFKQTG